jgi:hypothetical protein
VFLRFAGAVPSYATVDFGNAGFEPASADTNRLPGGFNNRNPAFMPLGVPAIRAAQYAAGATAAGAGRCRRLLADHRFLRLARGCAAS